MKQVPIETSRILRNKRKLEASLKVKLKKKGRNMLIEGEGEEEFIAEKVLEALNFGFKLEQALLLKREDFVLEEILIKNFTKRKDLSRIRARIVGKKGQTKKHIQDISNCLIALKDNTVAIIGEAQDIRQAMNGVINIIQGSKQGSVYSFMERCKKESKQRGQDLGLKE